MSEHQGTSGQERERVDRCSRTPIDGVRADAYRALLGLFATHKLLTQRDLLELHLMHSSSACGAKQRTGCDGRCEFHNGGSSINGELMWEEKKMCGEGELDGG